MNVKETMSQRMKSIGKTRGTTGEKALRQPDEPLFKVKILNYSLIIPK